MRDLWSWQDEDSDYMWLLQKARFTASYLKQYGNKIIVSALALKIPLQTCLFPSEWEYIKAGDTFL